MRKMDWGGDSRNPMQKSSYQTIVKNAWAWTKAVGMEMAVTIFSLLALFKKIMWLCIIQHSVLVS